MSTQLEGGYDAFSIVAQFAGAEERKTIPLVPPEELIAYFALSLVDDASGGAIRHSGFCGYDGQRGFDDGYDFMGALQARGWKALPAKGDWPYVVYVSWKPRAGERIAIAEYCEGDLIVWQFDNGADARAHYAGLRDAP